MRKICLDALILVLALTIVFNCINFAKVLGDDSTDDFAIEDSTFDDSALDDSTISNTIKNEITSETINQSSEKFSETISSSFISTQVSSAMMTNTHLLTKETQTKILAESSAEETNSISTSTTIEQVSTSPLSTDSLITQIETTSSEIITINNENPARSFNTIIDIRDLIRNRRRNTVKRVIIKLNRILFIDDVNATNVEQVLLNSIGYDTNFSVSNEGNDEFSINFVTQINTEINSDLTLDDNVLEIVNNLKRDENIINTEANKVNFDSNIDTSKAVIFAIENLVINGTTNRQVCQKSLDQILMSCQQGKVENETFVVETNDDIDLESFAISFEIPKLFLIFVVSISFFIQNLI